MSYKIFAIFFSFSNWPHTMDNFPFIFGAVHFNISCQRCNLTETQKSKYKLNKQKCIKNHRGKYRNVYSWFNFSRIVNGSKWHPCTFVIIWKWHCTMYSTAQANVCLFSFLFIYLFPLENRKCFCSLLFFVFVIVAVVQPVNRRTRVPAAPDDFQNVSLFTFILKRYG